jgi:hypothetical protein
LGSSSPQLSKPPPPVLEASTPTVPDEQSAASLNLWEEVFRKVNDETQKWIRQHGLDPLAEARPEDQIKELVDLVEEKEKFFEEKDSPVKIKIGSQDILFRAYVADVIGFLTMAGDVAISFAPPQASAPWAAAKAVLKVSIHICDASKVFSANRLSDPNSTSRPDGSPCWNGSVVYSNCPPRPGVRGLVHQRDNDK